MDNEDPTKPDPNDIDGFDSGLKKGTHVQSHSLHDLRFRAPEPKATYTEEVKDRPKEDRQR